MSEQEFMAYPFQGLGKQLKHLRQRKQETLAEVSGAVEIDPDMLSQFEQGEQRPSEAVLLLLMSHFDVPEEEAKKIWQQAGYTAKPSGSHETSVDDLQNKQMIMIMSLDARIVYTDQSNVTVNKYGVVLNFMQAGGLPNQPLAVARVGMSQEHARELLEQLKHSLESDMKKSPKLLPEPQNKSDKKA